ncbi:hypothetical protein K491DRAFT_690501 [Lophiostoma macrostomum CBS 122681]|uniref:BZIP domain-containing protein n=1 Tax=Lophiostoma macrostomum CBS 122681 TaxID=1314788 RepID=A0A6A6TFD3_9PLEO|nr:hypothetical protein K491DRAFT_690501 [Lophiostoma macrostomum CBS 122681]
MEADQQLYHSQLFAQALTTPALHNLDTHTAPPTHCTIDPASTTTIKMEDLAVPFPSMSPERSSLPPTSDPGFLSTNEHGHKTSKKRKSWGQVLPEPKTNLPPRKRAKTDDEKEQRRIERVKRNRLAAHNSRERKRQEVELLQAEKDKLEADLRQAHSAIAQMARQLKVYQARHPGEMPEPPSPIYDSSDSVIGSVDALDTLDTICPRQTSFPSPVSMDSMDSPRDDSCPPETPAYSDSVSAPELDPTQYSAAILCDLQCQSSSVRRSPRTSAPSTPQFQATLAFLTLFNLTLPLMMRSLWAICSTLSSSRTAPRQSRLAWTNPLAWLTLRNSSPSPSSNRLPSIRTAFRTLSMLNTSTCRQPLARHTSATGLSQQRSSSKCAARLARGLGRAGQDGVGYRRLNRSLRLRRAGRRHGMSSLERDTLRVLNSFRVPKGNGDRVRR